MEFTSSETAASSREAQLEAEMLPLTSRIQGAIEGWPAKPHDERQISLALTGEQEKIYYNNTEALKSDLDRAKWNMVFFPAVENSGPDSQSGDVRQPARIVLQPKS